MPALDFNVEAAWADAMSSPRVAADSFVEAASGVVRSNPSPADDRRTEAAYGDVKSSPSVADDVRCDTAPGDVTSSPRNPDESLDGADDRSSCSGADARIVEVCVLMASTVLSIPWVPSAARGT